MKLHTHFLTLLTVASPVFALAIAAAMHAGEIHAPWTEHDPEFAGYIEAGHPRNNRFSFKP